MPQNAATADNEMCLLQDVCVFELGQLVQVKILETMAARKFDKLRRNAHYFRGNDFVNIWLNTSGLKALDKVCVYSLDFERDPFVLVWVVSCGSYSAGLVRIYALHCHSDKV